MATLETATRPEFDGRGVPVILYAVLDLAGGNVPDQLRKLDWIAWSLFRVSATRRLCHGR